MCLSPLSFFPTLLLLLSFFFLSWILFRTLTINEIRRSGKKKKRKRDNYQWLAFCLLDRIGWDLIQEHRNKIGLVRIQIRRPGKKEEQEERKSIMTYLWSLGSFSVSYGEIKLRIQIKDRK